MFGLLAAVINFSLTFAIPIASVAALVSAVATGIALLNAWRERSSPGHLATKPSVSDRIHVEGRTAFKTELLVKQEAEELLRLHDELLAVVQRNRRALVELGAAENDGRSEG